MGNGEVLVQMRWDETYPGWMATAKTTTYTTKENGAVAIGEYAVSSDRGHKSSVLILLDILDKLGEEANIHPARMGQVSVVFDSQEVWDLRDRLMMLGV